MFNRISSLALKAIALAMAVAVVVTHIFGALTSESAVAMLAFGLAALALEALHKDESSSLNK
jgi:uncharacterized membrane protein